MGDRRTSVQRAYDAAVDPEGWPTVRVRNMLRLRLGLAGEVLSVADTLTDRIDDDVDPRDAFIAGFSVAMVWIADNTGATP